MAVMGTNPQVVLATRSTTGPTMNSAVAGDSSGQYSAIRCLFDYASTVSAIVIGLYIRFPGSSTWYKASDTDDGVPLTGTDELRDFHIGESVDFAFTVESITGGGSVTISAVGVKN